MDAYDDETERPKIAPLWRPRQPRLPTHMHTLKATTKNFEREPYKDCVKMIHALHLGEERREEEQLREEAGGAKKKSSRGALMVGDTKFKRWDVPAHTTWDDEEDDERDVWLLKEMHHQMTHADTYMELSASKVFAVDYFDRGISLTCILTYCICAGILIQKVEEIRNKFVVNIGDAYAWPANYLWWNSLQVWNYMMIAHCFGILQFMVIPIIRRLYYVMFSFSFIALLCAYLQKQGCWALCPLLWWSGFVLTLVTAGRPPITNRMGAPLADVLFFGIFVLLALQAICARDEDMVSGTILLLAGFAYAGPIGYWGFFNWRVVIFTACLFNAIPTLEQAVANKTGSYTPKTLTTLISNDWRKVLTYVTVLPVGWGCPMKNCEPDLYTLFEGGPLGRWGGDDDENLVGAGSRFYEAVTVDFADALRIELPPSFDDALFWLFVVGMVVFDLYTMHVTETVKDVETAPPPGPCAPFDTESQDQLENLCQSTSAS